MKKLISGVVMAATSGLVAVMMAGVPAIAHAATAQRVAVPSYFYPGNDWQRLEDAAPTAGISIVNPNSGPGTGVDQAFVDQVKSAQSKGQLVLGYVRTQWAARSSDEVKAEVDEYYNWYGVSGIFFDEAATDCGSEPYYENLKSYVKAKDSSATVVLNPGTSTAECYTQAADILVTFEHDYGTYTGYTPDSWTLNYPAERFWHLVYDTPAGQLGDAITRSKNNHAGWVYATPLPLDPNPWGALPDDSYWSTELSLAQG